MGLEEDVEEATQLGGEDALLMKNLVPGKSIACEGGRGRSGGRGGGGMKRGG